MYDIDTFLERVALFNNLVTKEQIDAAKDVLDEYPGSNLLDALIHVEAVDAPTAKGLLETYRKWARDMQAREVAREAARATQQVHASGTSLADPGSTANISVDELAGFAAIPGMSAEHALPAGGASTPGVPRMRPLGLEALDPQSPGFQELDRLLTFARREGASDVHIKVGCPAMVRRLGALLPIANNSFERSETEHLLLSHLINDYRDMAEEHDYLEFATHVEGEGRYRFCIYRHQDGWDGAIRVVRAEVPTFEDLGLPTSIARLTQYKQGMVLVAGPKGSGKSSTLAAMIDLVNHTREEHIVTVEDPIEYVFTPDKSHISQREVGTHTFTFGHALRGALREDPDVIMIGEMRDLTTIEVAITAAETGHLVFGTLHTSSAPRTVDRIVEVFPADEQRQIRHMVSESLRGIVCQVLLPRADGEGQVLGLEIMYNTPAIANLIRDNKLHRIHTAIQMGRNQGMILMDDYLDSLVEQGILDGREAFFSAKDKGRFAHHVRE